MPRHAHRGPRFVRGVHRSHNDDPGLKSRPTLSQNPRLLRLDARSRRCHRGEEEEEDEEDAPWNACHGDRSQPCSVEAAEVASRSRQRIIAGIA
ncbi:hypothetical protein HPB50_013114 [Hyalomma asiaticum]|uniref:Uncharacterized protein n=1 Tax=Hyalomma asiaticum TaxID=266040 RepID=A0ACB7S8G7_HYAAI|nr:hypothetical protein HPB50_013114 [Hyalomma asiaticum]